MILPGPKRNYALSLNLRLVEALEREGCLISLAERLTAGIAAREEVLARLKTVYQAAGCLLPFEALRRFLEENVPERLLGNILLNLLTPLLAMGAVQPGERQPARSGGSTFARRAGFFWGFWAGRRKRSCARRAFRTCWTLGLDFRPFMEKERSGG